MKNIEHHYRTYIEILKTYIWMQTLHKIRFLMKKILMKSTCIAQSFLESATRVSSIKVTLEFSFSIWMFTDLQRTYIKSFFALDAMHFASPSSENVDWNIESYWMIYNLDTDREWRCLERFTSSSYWLVKKNKFACKDPRMYVPSSKYGVTSHLCYVARGLIHFHQRITFNPLELSKRCICTRDCIEKIARYIISLV